MKTKRSKNTKPQQQRTDPVTIDHEPRKAPLGAMPRANAPKVDHNAGVPARLIEENRANSNAIITSLNKTAVALASKDGGVQQVEIMERLYAMQRMAEDRQSENEFGIAKVALAMGLPTIPKLHKIEFVDKNNTKQEREYANRVDIESVLDPLCRLHGFSKEYSTETDAKGWACQVLTVRHVGGHKEVYRSPFMPLDTSGAKNNQQGAGSTSEYGKRYALVGAFNIIGVDKDDDGNQGRLDEKQTAGDQFTDRVKSDAAKAADKVPEQKPDDAKKSEMALPEAAAALEQRLRSMPVEKRGEYLMRHNNLITAMADNVDLAPKVAELHKLCQEATYG